jgi:hypothetical protein
MPDESRRKFITLLGSGAAWPLELRLQQSQKSAPTHFSFCRMRWRSSKKGDH